MNATNLDLALRRNRGKLMRQTWLDKLKQACNYDVTSAHFLSLEQTEDLKKSFFERVRNGNNINCQSFAKTALDEAVKNRLLDLSIDLQFTPVVLFSSVDQYIGAVQIPANFVLSNFQSVWKVVEEDFCLTTLDLESGLCIEADFYDDHGEYVKDGICKLSVWGIFAA